MATCDVCQRPPQFGNNVSHSNVKTRRTFDIAVSGSTIRCECRKVSIKVNSLCNKCRRTFDMKGVDAWTLSNRHVWKAIKVQALRKFFRDCYECHKFGFDEAHDI